MLNMNMIKRLWRKMNRKVFLAAVAFCLFVGLVIVSAAGLRGITEYIDSPVFVYMMLFTAAALYCTGTGKDFCNGFRFAFFRHTDISRMELQKAVSAVRFAKKIVTLEAVVISAVYLVDLLYHMESPATMGPALAITFLSAFYAGLFAILLTLVSGRLDMMIASYMEEPEAEISVDEAQTIYFKLRALGLTDREAEVARLVSCEMTNREIGQLLYISDNTVKKHITHILDKTKLTDREELTEMIRGL